MTEKINQTEKVEKTEKSKKRAGFLDEVRGFAILCMVVYHAMFDLEAFFGKEVPIFFDNWFYYIWAVFAGSFIFISGIVCRYSSNNVKRGAQCFFFGMILTYVTVILAPEVAIQFGILHMLGVSMMLYGLGEKIWDKGWLSPKIGMAISAFLFAITWNISGSKDRIDGVLTKIPGIVGLGALSVRVPVKLYELRLLFPLGFPSRDFYSGDFFPLMPWFFLFMTGAFFGVYVKNGKCPSFFYKTRVPFLAAVGRHTIWIYLFHQPVVLGVLYLGFWIFKILYG